MTGKRTKYIVLCASAGILFATVIAVKIADAKLAPQQIIGAKPDYNPEDNSSAGFWIAGR
jgi:hypothetical protein